jgi:hypothetical protein
MLACALPCNASSFTNLCHSMLPCMPSASFHSPLHAGRSCARNHVQQTRSAPSSSPFCEWNIRYQTSRRVAMAGLLEYMCQPSQSIFSGVCARLLSARGLQDVASISPFFWASRLPARCKRPRSDGREGASAHEPLACYRHLHHLSIRSAAQLRSEAFATT